MHLTSKRDSKRVSSKFSLHSKKDLKKGSKTTPATKGSKTMPLGIETMDEPLNSKTSGRRGSVSRGQTTIGAAGGGNLFRKSVESMKPLLGLISGPGDSLKRVSRASKQAFDPFVTDARRVKCEAVAGARRSGRIQS